MIYSMTELPEPRPARHGFDACQKMTLSEAAGDDGWLADHTPAERLAMVWPMTRDCWAFIPGYDAQQPFQRNVVRVSRRKG